MLNVLKLCVLTAWLPLQNCGVEITSINAKWCQNNAHNTLSEITARVKTGQLLIVVGPVGSGKVHVAAVL